MVIRVVPVRFIRGMVIDGNRPLKKARQDLTNIPKCQNRYHNRLIVSNDSKTIPSLVVATRKRNGKNPREARMMSLWPELIPKRMLALPRRAAMVIHPKTLLKLQLTAILATRKHPPALLLLPRERLDVQEKLPSKMTRRVVVTVRHHLLVLLPPQREGLGVPARIILSKFAMTRMEVVTIRNRPRRGVARPKMPSTSKVDELVSRKTLY